MIIRKAEDPYIVFDLDDTLFQEVDFLLSAYREIARMVSAEESAAILDRMVEKYRRSENVFEWLMGAYSDRMPDLTIDRLLQVYRNHFPEIELSEDAHDFLSRLRQADISFGLITDGRSITQRNKLRALGIEALFSEIIISEEFGSQKPNPANYRFYEDRYPGKKFYYIGDNTGKDFIVPSNLGWTTVCIKDRGQNIHPQQLDRLPVPDYIVSTFKEIEIV